MKKIVSLLLAMLAMLSAAAFAEPDSAAEEIFSFRNDITWGMSLDEVTAIEGEPDDVYDMNNGQTVDVEYADVEVSRYISDLAYFFVNDKLVFSSYYNFDLSDDIETDFQYLNGALSSLYGESVSVNETDILAYITALLSGETVDWTVRNCSEWTIGDHTRIWSFIWNESDIYIMYIDADFDPMAEIGYNTKGL